jgi:hypothetical protein
VFEFFLAFGVQVESTNAEKVDDTLER